MKQCRPRPCDCDVDCPAGAVCGPGGCLADHVVCQDHADCPPTQRCRLRTAAPCTQPDAARTTCEPWPCACDEDCPADQVCAGADGIECIDGRRCSFNADCPAGYVCHFVAPSHCAHEQTTLMCVPS